MIFPKEGNAIVGEAIWLNNSNSREFMYTEIDSLLKGHKYCLSFYIAHAQSSGFICKNIQALFMDEIINYNINEFLNYQPQIQNEKDFFEFGIWYHIEGDFIATGSEKYLYLGNFTPFNQSNCAYFNGNDSLLFGNSNYIFLDDVILTDCSEYIIPNIFSPNNDGINDSIDFTHHSIVRVEIFNQWGNIVYKSSDLSKCWKGQDLIGNELFNGVYFYKVIFENEIKTGFINLVR
jgi:gliding motility-associated-like protein